MIIFVSLIIELSYAQGNEEKHFQKLIIKMRRKKKKKFFSKNEESQFSRSPQLRSFSVFAIIKRQKYFFLFLKQIYIHFFIFTAKTPFDD